MESPLRRAHLFPFHRELRHDLELLVVLDERFVDVAIERVVEAFVLGIRIEREHVALTCPAKRLRVTGRRRQHRREYCRNTDLRTCTHYASLWTLTPASR